MTQEIRAEIPNRPLATEVRRLVLDAERASGLWIRAQGFLMDDAFLVLRESGAFVDEESGSGPGLSSADRHLRAQLVDNGYLARDGGTYVFLRDCLFSSPAAAASAILGRSADGRREWRDTRGERLADALAGA